MKRLVELLVGGIVGLGVIVGIKLLILTIGIEKEALKLMEFVVIVGVEVGVGMVVVQKMRDFMEPKL